MAVLSGVSWGNAPPVQADGTDGSQHGLVITLFRPTRPRDLDHYEFFTGYHRALQRWVEPVTVTPFAPRARERSLGPIQVALLRQAPAISTTMVPSHWRRELRLVGGRYDSSASRMASERNTPIMAAIAQVLENRAGSQPNPPRSGTVCKEAGDALDRWRSVAQKAVTSDDVVYSESSALRPPKRHVVLGDPAHNRAATSMNIDQAFPNAPQSLRDVEETTGVWVP